jgi:acyl-CoA thioesterase-1
MLAVAGPAWGAPLRLLVLGDSLSAGYGLPHDQGFEVQLQRALKAQGHDVSIIDGAVSGDTSAGGRARLDWTLGDGADAAIVELGANDGLRGVDPKDMGRIWGRSWTSWRPSTFRCC